MGTYRVGNACADITPPVGMPYLAWRPRHQPFTGVNDPLLARAACIEAGGERVVVISSDTISLVDTLLGEGRSFTGEIMQGIERRTGVPPSHIMLASNHIHSSAETVCFRPLSNEYPDAHRWLEGLQETLLQCAVSACENTFEARLRIGKGQAPGLVMNRRGDDCIDEEVTALIFEGEQGPALVMANFACHPVVMQVQELVSADYVGVTTSTVERSVQGLRSCMFLLGACGDINPIMGDTRNYADSLLIGRALGQEVVRIVRASDCLPIEPAVVRAASTRVQFPSRCLPSGGDLAQYEGNEDALLRTVEGSGPFFGEVKAVRIGGALLIGMPGEVFCATGKAIKEMCRPLTGVPVGYVGHYLGYFVPPEAWDNGGYEVQLGQWSKVAPEAVGVLLEAIGTLVKRVCG